MHQSAAAEGFSRLPRLSSFREEPPTRPAQVLILEDEQIVAEDLRRSLQELGYDAYGVAATTVAALALARKTPPEVVVADIRLKDSSDGIDAAIRLREEYGAAVVFLTAHADDATVDRARDAKPTGYLVKPISMPSLRAAIEVALERRAHEVELQARERALRETSIDLLSALNSLPFAVHLEDLESRVVHVNEAFCSLFGIVEPRAELIGMDGKELLSRIQGLSANGQHFALVTDSLRRARQPMTGDVLSLSDGRKIEVGYLPVRSAEERRGQLWTYRDISESVHERDELEQSARDHHHETLTDTLTGLTSRRGFFQLSRTYLRFVRCREEQRRVLFFVDLDGLKTINDRHGHAAGDQAICATAQALRKTFRVTDLLARLGGDEFVVLATVRPDDIEAIKQRLAAQVGEFNRRASPPYQLAVSIGVVEHRVDESLDGFVARADEAMYREKRSKHARETPRES